MVEYELPKLGTRVRFPSSAPERKDGCVPSFFFCAGPVLFLPRAKGYIIKNIFHTGDCDEITG